MGGEGHEDGDATDPLDPLHFQSETKNTCAFAEAASQFGSRAACMLIVSKSYVCDSRAMHVPSSEWRCRTIAKLYIHCIHKYLQPHKVLAAPSRSSLGYAYPLTGLGRNGPLPIVGALRECERTGQANCQKSAWSQNSRVTPLCRRSAMTVSRRCSSERTTR